MRKLAWLHATPEGKKKSRLEEIKAVSEDSLLLKLPDLEGADYIIVMLREAGLMSSTGMGPVPLSWLEIDAWMRVTEAKPCLWERLFIKELSEAYVGELVAATDKNRESPYVHVEEPEEIDREAVASRLADAFSSFRKAKKD